MNLKQRTVDYIAKIKVSVEGIDVEYGQLASELSIYDKMLSEAYHKIENNKYNVVSGYKELKHLKEVLTKRREVKFQLCLLTSVRDTVNGLDTRVENIESRYFKDNPYYKEVFDLG